MARRTSKDPESLRKSSAEKGGAGGEGGDSAQKPKTTQEVPKEALKAIMASTGFNEFLDKSSKIIERVLQNPESDLVIDYFGDTSDAKEGK